MQRRTIRLIAIFAASLILTIAAQAVRPPAATSTSFKARAERAWVMAGDRRVDAESGMTLAWYDPGVPVRSGVPEAAATAFLREHASLFGGAATVESMRPVEVKESPAGKHVVLQQTVSGIPVYTAWMTVSLSRRGTVNFVVGNPYGNFTLPATAPAISADRAVAATRALLAGKGPDLSEPAAELNGYRDENGVDHLAWVVRYASMDPMGDWEVVWDALSGERLEVADRMVYVDGTGMVWDPDPLTTAGVNYGTAGYTDNNDADSPQLNDERVTVTLRDITLDGGVYHLSGPYVTIADFESPSVAPVTSIDPDNFIYTRTQSGFEDVMAYYHIDHAQRHIQDLGFTNIQNLSINVDPHGLNGSDNSHYIPSQNRIAWGEGGVDDAEDADVLYHEYGHAVQIGTVGAGQWSGGETGALGEGFGDYWAGTFSQRISDYHSEWVFNWDGHNPFWPGRVLNYSGHYPDDWTGQIHTDGQIWSSALWNIRAEIGADTMDALVLQSHYYLSSGATMPDNAQAVLQADMELFGGVDEAAIGAEFIARGLISELPPRGTVSGLVRDIDTGEPIEGAEAALEVTDDVRLDTTDIDGLFSFGLVTPGIHELTVSAAGYNTWAGMIEVVNDETTTVEINLGQPDIIIMPDELEVEMFVDTTLDTTLQLSNNGSGGTNWSLRLRPDGVDPVVPWEDLEVTLNLTDITGDVRVYGVEVVDGNYILAGGNSFTNPNKLYEVTAGGELVGTVDQPTGSTIGFTDLAWDGNLLYGSDSHWIIGVDTEGVPQDSIFGPLNPNRALAYDPEDDWFWTADNQSDIIAVDREGVEQARLPNVLMVQGLSWYPFDLDGMPLVMTSYEPIPGGGNTLRVSKMNPETGEVVHLVEQAETSSNERFLGLAVSARLAGGEGYWLGPVIQAHGATSVDLNVFRVDNSVPYVDATPRRGALDAGEDTTLTLHFDTFGLEAGWYYAFLEVMHEVSETPIAVPISLHAVDVGAVEKALPETFALEPAHPNPFNPSTSWTLHLPERARVTLTVYDVLGRRVDRVAFGPIAPGVRRIAWAAPAGTASGVYLVRVDAGKGRVAGDKVVLLK
ncbi:MAG TPA: T9SS type A sorting domain-containing protein [Bacteroidetes bacterium]|nr:T9SS type A sorting domain-containing protein [Bacteroidota bacterium]